MDNLNQFFKTSFQLEGKDENMGKPTIWELITQNQMNELFLPAFENLIKNGRAHFYD
jgi:hypothetical protein